MRNYLHYVVLFVLLIIATVTFLFKDDMVRVYYDFFVIPSKKVKIAKKNSYYRPYDFEFVKNTDNFEPATKQDLINIIYTVINSGKREFTFYCPKSYETCLQDVKDIARDQVLLSNINNYVHPFNSFRNISTQTDTLGTVIISITKTYTYDDIRIVKENVKAMEKELFDPNLSQRDQIKKIHDYIIENSKYDSNRTDNGIIDYKSDIAYGPLIEGYGICGGYSDAMELFLEDLGIKSFKVSSDTHVWNAVNLDGTWYNLDLTWDDPVTNTGDQILDDKFFLISTNELLSLEQSQHNFDLNSYKELSN